MTVVAQVAFQQRVVSGHAAMAQGNAAKKQHSDLPQGQLRFMFPKANVILGSAHARERSFQMRSIGWVVAILAVGGLSAGASAAETCCGSQATFTGHGASAAYCAPACAAPGYGSLVPGCCELPPSCCDNVWDGYCQERRHGRCAVPRPCYFRPAPACFTQRFEYGCGAPAACGHVAPGCQAGEAPGHGEVIEEGTIDPAEEVPPKTG